MMNSLALLEHNMGIYDDLNISLSLARQLFKQQD